MGSRTETQISVLASKSILFQVNHLSVHLFPQLCLKFLQSCLSGKSFVGLEVQLLLWHSSLSHWTCGSILFSGYRSAWLLIPTWPLVYQHGNPPNAAPSFSFQHILSPMHSYASITKSTVENRPRVRVSFFHRALWHSAHLTMAYIF